MQEYLSTPVVSVQLVELAIQKNRIDQQLFSHVLDYTVLLCDVGKIEAVAVSQHEIDRLQKIDNLALALLLLI